MIERVKHSDDIMKDIIYIVSLQEALAFLVDRVDELQLILKETQNESFNEFDSIYTEFLNRETALRELRGCIESARSIGELIDIIESYLEASRVR